MDWNCMSTRGCQNWSSFWALNVILLLPLPFLIWVFKRKTSRGSSWREFCIWLSWEAFQKKFKGYKLLESNCFLYFSILDRSKKEGGRQFSVNGMTLSTEFNKSHICVCVWQKRECCSREGNNLVFRRCYLLFLRRNRQPSFEKSSTTALIRSG